MSKKLKLEDIPGIGPKTADSLKEAGFKTVKSLAKADPEKLMEKVDGIGETTATQIIKEARKLIPKEKTKQEKSEKKKEVKPEKKPKAEVKKVEKVELTDIPGVGPKTADSLKEAGFKTVKSLAKADPEKLMEKVDGIGDTLAEQIIEEAGKLVPAEPKKKAPKKKEKAKVTKRPKKKKEPKEIDIPSRATMVDKRLLRIAKEKRRRQPKFRHEQAHRWTRVKDSWRKVRGIDSATREKRKGRISMVSAGYRKPKAIRGLHPSLYEEVLVHRPDDLEGLDPDIHAIRIGGTVGQRKRVDIIQKAETMLLRVLNPGVPEVLEEEDLFEELEDLEVD
jgi:large subunit ribosomal protein L32e